MKTLLEKIIFIIFLVLIFYACHPTDKKMTVLEADSVVYVNINSKDYTPMFLRNENNEIIDTIVSPILKTIRNGQYNGIRSKEGLIKDALTAKRVALAILLSFYGKECLQSEKPFTVSLIDNKYWFISGTLPKGCVGGVAEILLSKEDGKIMYLNHSK